MSILKSSSNIFWKNSVVMYKVRCGFQISQDNIDSISGIKPGILSKYLHQESPRITNAWNWPQQPTPKNDLQNTRNSFDFFQPSEKEIEKWRLTTWGTVAAIIALSFKRRYSLCYLFSISHFIWSSKFEKRQKKDRSGIVENSTFHQNFFSGYKFKPEDIMIRPEKNVVVHTKNN